MKKPEQFLQPQSKESSQLINGAVMCGLLGPQNIYRLVGENIHNYSTSDKGIIVPALRTIDDFTLGERVWFFDPSVHSTHQHGVVSSFITELNQLSVSRLDNNTGFQTIISPTHYSLWRLSDVKTIMQFNDIFRGQGTPNPMSIIEAVQRDALPDNNDLLLRSIHRKLSDRPSDHPHLANPLSGSSAIMHT